MIEFIIGTEAELIKLRPIIDRMDSWRISITYTGQNNLMDSSVNDISKAIHKNYIVEKKIFFPFKLYILRVIWMMVWFLYAVTKMVYIGRLNKPRQIVVHGDTLSTLLGLIRGKLNGISVIHVESYLTSNKLMSPFPEEITRRIVSKYSDLSFCSTFDAYIRGIKDMKHNKNKIKVHYTYGNSLWDMISTLAGIERIEIDNSDKYFVLVVHRQEHLINDFLLRVSKAVKENQGPLKCVFVAHDQTMNKIKELNCYKVFTEEYGWTLLSRQKFPQFIKLINNAEYLITDGGSNQEESYYLGLPCFVLRDVTERDEGLGLNVVLSRSLDGDLPEFMTNYSKYRHSKRLPNPSPSSLIADEINAIMA